MLEHIIISNLSESPHSPTLHDNESGYVTLSFCSGTLMAQSHENMWYDSMSRRWCTTQHYQRIVSPAASLVCFPQYINPVRLGLSNIYLNQAVCTPSCRYQLNITAAP